MSTAMTRAKSGNFRTSFTSEEDRKFLPAYLQSVPESTIEKECVTEGEFPSWLRGNFLRMGTHEWVLPTSDDGSTKPVILQHWFDGLAMLHNFRMLDGRIYHRSRRTNNGLVKQVRETGRYEGLTMGPDPNQEPPKPVIDPCSQLLGSQQSHFFGDTTEASFLPPDVLNVNVVPRRAYALPDDRNPYSKGTPAANPESEELLISTDFNMLQVCDAKTLEPKRLLTYAVIDKELAGSGIASHQMKDRKRRTEYNYLNDNAGKMYVFALDTASRPAKLLWKTPLPCKKSYVHCLGGTQTYVVFIRMPIELNTNVEESALEGVLSIQQDAWCHYYLLHKDTGKLVATYRTPGYIYFHMANAYEFTDDKTGQLNVHVDVCSYSDSHIPGNEYIISNILDPLKPFSNGTLVRYELTDVLGNYHPETVRRGSVLTSIPNAGVELPRIRKDMSMVPGYRYIWSVCENGGVSPGTEIPIGRLGSGVKHISRAFLGHLVKTDWKTGKSLHWYPEDGESCPCEPIFVERPGSTIEDDGVVLTIVCNKTGTHSILIALDGQTMKEVARAIMPQVFGLGPHGTFIEGW